MKKILILLTAVAMILVFSCKKDATPTPVTKTTPKDTTPVVAALTQLDTLSQNWKPTSVTVKVYCQLLSKDTTVDLYTSMQSCEKLFHYSLKKDFTCKLIHEVGYCTAIADTSSTWSLLSRSSIAINLPTLASLAQYKSVLGDFDLKTFTIKSYSKTSLVLLQVASPIITKDNYSQFLPIVSQFGPDAASMLSLVFISNPAATIPLTITITTTNSVVN